MDQTRVEHGMKRLWLILPMVSFAVSAIGVWHALPMHVVGDEEALMGGALKMIELKTLIPSLHPEEFALLYYPPLISYLILIAIAPVVLVAFFLFGLSASNLQDYFALNQNALWIAARLLSALCAAGTVAVVFQIAKRLMSEKTAWISSLLLVTSFLHVVVSHWVRHWTFTTFFVYATVLAWMLVGSSMNDHGYGILHAEIIAGRCSPNVRHRLSSVFYLLPGILGGLGFGVSYIGSLGFFAGFAHVWFQRKEVFRLASADADGLAGAQDNRKMFWRIVRNNVVVFVGIAILFAVLNIQEVHRMIGPTDGTLSEPKRFVDFIATVRDIGLILIRQEILLVVSAVFGIVFGTRFRKMSGTIIVWMIVYAILIYGAFHLELRYVYVLIPALCLLSGVFFETFVLRVSSRIITNVVACLLLVWPVLTVVRYEQLLLKQDTREQAIGWIQDHVRSGDSFLLSSDTMVLPRTNESIENDQTMGSVRAGERYQLHIQTEKLKTQHDRRFNYYNVHFWRDDIAQDEIDRFIQQQQPKYVIVDYWSEETLSDRERKLMKQGRLITQFKQSRLIENIDVNGNFFAFNDILFKLERLGPTVDVYEL